MSISKLPPVYELRYSPDALNALDDPRALPRRVAVTAMTRMEAIAADPFANHANVERLKGMKGGYRLRIGDWRVVYAVDTARRTVLVAAVKHRSEVYR